VEGGAVLLLLTVPWWLAVHHALGGTGIRGTQLAGSLMVPSWDRLLDPYYFYRPLELVLPAVVVVAIAAVGRWWPRDETGAMRLLAAFVAVPAIGFSLGLQQRPHYMLPALAPMCILVALGLRAIVDGSGRSGLGRLLAALCGVVLAVELVLAGSTRTWSRERLLTAELATLAGRTFAADVPLLAFDHDVGTPSYYAGRVVRRATTIRAVVDAVDGRPGEIGLLIERPALARLPRDLDVREIGSGPLEPGRDLVLARVRRPGAT
jgi:hypothetical protein